MKEQWNNVKPNDNYVGWVKYILSFTFLWTALQKLLKCALYIRVMRKWPNLPQITINDTLLQPTNAPIEYFTDCNQINVVEKNC